MKLVNQAAVKRLVKEKGKRCSAVFLERLEAHVQKKVEAAAAQHNGGRITLDLDVAASCGIV